MTTIKDNLYYPKKNPMQEAVPGLKKKCQDLTNGMDP